LALNATNTTQEKTWLKAIEKMHKDDGWITKLTLWLRLLVLAWVSIKKMSDLSFITPFQNPLKTMFKNVVELGEMASQLIVYYTIAIQTELDFNTLWSKMNSQQVNAKMKICSFCIKWWSIAKSLIFADENFSFFI